MRSIAASGALLPTAILVLMGVVLFAPTLEADPPAGGGAPGSLAPKAAAAPSTGGKASVSLVVGLGKLQRGGAKEERIAPGMTIRAGDVISTLKGARLEITLASGSVARLGEQSVLRVTDVAPDRLHATVEPMTGGSNAKIWVNASKAKGAQDIKVRTPVVLTAVRGTIFHIAAAASGSADGTRVRCYEGATSVAPLADESADSTKTPSGGFKIGAPTPVPGPHQVTLEEFTVIVKAMQEVVITRQNRTTKQEAHPFDADEDRRDEWVAWNRGLDDEPRN